ncbi:MAG: hypothetical protein KDB03_17215 [Planctomycetales bacterium]|nr:hypothetical protein [Planctomycetales bacterium]
MLLYPKFSVLCLATAILHCSLADFAKAGPLIDWLFGRSNSAPAYPVGPPVALGQAGPYASQMPYVGAYNAYRAGYGGYGYNPIPSGISAAQVPPTVSYVPNYNSIYNRAPVTYYRPVLTTDPNTGAQVVSMAPCTSYEYQLQRVPTWGYSALSQMPATPPVPTQAVPTYSLPSGGIPLASGSSVPYSMGYRGLQPMSPYSVYQPTVPAPTTGIPGAAFGTVPMTSTPYYGTTTGGCSGGYSSSIVPQIPNSGIISSPPYSAPNLSPGVSVPGAGGAILPGNISSDPRAFEVPGLPSVNSSSSNLQPRLRAIIREPVETQSASSERVAPASTQDSRPSFPAMAPLTAPEDIDTQRRWNPGLLSEQDLTADLGEGSPKYQSIAAYGDSKKIHWASFDNTPMDSNANMAAQDQAAELKLQAPSLRTFQPLPRLPESKELEYSAKPAVPPAGQSQSVIRRAPNAWKASH